MVGQTVVAVAVLLASGSAALAGQTQAPHPGPAGTTAGFRGVSALGDRVWASGQRGTFIRSADGGATWRADSVAAAHAFDFRDVQQLDARTALLMVAGSDTARIYRSDDAGANWTLTFDDTQKGAFLDALAFWDGRRGLAVGDLLAERFVILRTDDGGRTWQRTPREALPPALANEGAFAASGACLVTGPDGRAWLATGGAASARVFRSTDDGRSWQVTDLPIPTGTASAGAFALAFRDKLHGVAVGGDYAAPDAQRPNVAITEDGGVTWRLGDTTRVVPFLSGVTYAGSGDDARLVAVGTRGVYLSADGGVTWRKLSDKSFNAVAPVGKGRSAAVVAVGDRGAVERLTLP